MRNRSAKVEIDRGCQVGSREGRVVVATSKFGLLIDIEGGDVVHVDGCSQIATWDEQVADDDSVVLERTVVFGADLLTSKFLVVRVRG